MSQLVIVTGRFLAVTFHGITLYVVNNHLIARTITHKNIKTHQKNVNTQKLIVVTSFHVEKT